VALARGWRSPAFDVVMCLTAIVSLQALTVDVPASARLAITGPLIAILVAVGLDCLTRRVSFGRGRLATGLAALGVAFFSITGLRFYFFEYAPIHEGTALPQTELAYLMRTYAPGTRYLLFTEPAFSCGSHATLAFIAPEQVCVDPVLDNGRITNTALQPGDIIAATANQRAVAQQFVAEGLPDYPMDPEEIAPDMGLSIWRPRGGT
ncbi:MAG TPA: hypothetical protein VHX16_07055, partial [Chloroflexota bacterium]|nr:hypothetical protein [Chloroflexota bacterium]